MYRILIFGNKNYFAKNIETFINSNSHAPTFVLVDNLEKVDFLIGNFSFDIYMFSLLENADFILGFAEKLKTKSEFKTRPFIFIGENKYKNKALKIKCSFYMHTPLNDNSFNCVCNVLYDELKTMSEYCTFFLSGNYSRSASINNLCENNISLFDRSVSNLYLNFDLTNNYYKIMVNDIYFIEYLNRKCTIHTRNGKITIPFSLKKVLEISNNTSLIRSHKSFIINSNNISIIDKNNDSWIVHFSSYQKTALVSRMYRKSLSVLLKQYKD